MSHAPKLVFDSEKELLECLEEWKRLLALSDWHIAARICPKEDMKLPESAGESEVYHVNMCGLIRILRAEDLPPDLILKQSMEQVLIHELLHFKFIAFDEESREEAVFEIAQHQLIENLAKALFMAKYGLTPTWFIAEPHKSKEEDEDEAQTR